MLVVMQRGAAAAEVRRVTAVIEEMGFQARPMVGSDRTAIEVIGTDRPVDGSRLATLPGVQEVVRITQPYRQASREWKPEPTVIRLNGGIGIGGAEIVVMAGPCAVESERQLLSAATTVREAGAAILRWLRHSSPSLVNSPLPIKVFKKRKTGGLRNASACSTSSA